MESWLSKSPQLCHFVPAWLNLHMWVGCPFGDCASRTSPHPRTLSLRASSCLLGVFGNAQPRHVRPALRKPVLAHTGHRPKLLPPPSRRRRHIHRRVGHGGCPTSTHRAGQPQVQAARPRSTAVRRLRNHPSFCTSMRRRIQCNGGRSLATWDCPPWARDTLLELRHTAALSLRCRARSTSEVRIQRETRRMRSATARRRS